MPILDSSLAVAVGAGVNNVVLQPAAGVLSRNIVVIGTYNPTLNGTITDAVPQLVANDADASAKFGAGFMIHRLVKAAQAGHKGVIPVWVIPQQEVAGAAATSSTFAITGPATAAGVFAAYVAGIRYAIPVALNDSAVTIGTALAAAINADSACPCTAAGTATVSLTSKSKGLWGNYIKPAVNILPGDALPASVACTVTVLSGGTGVPVLANALNGLGTGTNKNTLPNGQQVTAIVCGYSAGAATLDQTSETAIAGYNGLGNSSPPDGCYDHLVAKPLRWLWGDTTANASVPSGATTFATTNMQDRGGGLICAPGSCTHPSELAAQALGYMERINAYRAEQNYIGVVLEGVDPGYAANTAGTRWSNDYTQRDNAVKGGVTPTLCIGGYVVLQNVVTFYSCNTGVPSTSNAYRAMRNISIIQNMLAAEMANFKGPKWQGYTIVSDTNNVTDPTSKANARDVQAVIDDLVALIKSFASRAWIYDPVFSINSLKAAGAVTVRTGGDGFLATISVILSGEGNILDITENIDTSIAVLSIAA
jgi:hypothetical protein